MTVQLLAPVRDRPYFLTGDGLRDARLWLAEIEAGEWPERAQRTYMALAGGAVIADRKILPKRTLASRQVAILRRVVRESRESLNRWLRRNPPDHDLL